MINSQDKRLIGSVFSRRGFCKSAVVAGGGLAAGVGVGGPGTVGGLSKALGAAEKKEDAKFKLRYIVASSMYGELPLKEIVPEVRKTGTAYLDIWPKPHGNQREQVSKLGVDKTIALLKQHDVKVGMLTHYMIGPLKLSSEMGLMNKLGAKIVISGSKGPRNVKGKEAKAGVKKFLELMKPQIAAAEKHDVVIGIENHANALLHTPDSIRYFGDLNKSKHIGVALAPYHLPQDAEEIGKLMIHLGDQLVHFYGWEHGDGCHKRMAKVLEMKQMPGRGPLDFGPMVDAMKKISYTGWTSIFMHPTPRGIPILPTAGLVTHEINLSRAYMESLV